MSTLRNIIQNQHGYFLDVRVPVVAEQLTDATVFDSAEAGQAAFDDLNDCEAGYIPELIRGDDGRLYITGANTLTGEPEPAALSAEQIINQYLF